MSKRICPECGSKEIILDTMHARGGSGGEYICKNCGFKSPLFPDK